VEVDREQDILDGDELVLRDVWHLDGL
jgi:hypothetical protein